MRGMNKAIIVGNVGRDPEVKRFNEAVVAKFSMATTDVWKDKNGDTQEETMWHNIEVWGKLAEIVEKYVTKGMPLAVEGKMVRKDYEDDQGNKRSSFYVKINDMKFLGSGQKTTEKQANYQDNQGNDDIPF